MTYASTSRLGLSCQHFFGKKKLKNSQPLSQPRLRQVQISDKVSMDGEAQHLNKIEFLRRLSKRLLELFVAEESDVDFFFWYLECI